MYAYQIDIDPEYVDFTFINITIKLLTVYQQNITHNFILDSNKSI